VGGIEVGVSVNEWAVRDVRVDTNKRIKPAPDWFIGFAFVDSNSQNLVNE